MLQVLCGNSLSPAKEIRPYQGVEAQNVSVADRKVAVSWKTEKETTGFNLARNSSN